jgi:predicted P-loop ATPase
VNDICREFELKFDFQKGDKQATEKRVDAIIKNSRTAPPFDPLKEFFETTKWDGKNRIDKLIDTVKVKEVQLTARGRTFTTSEVWKEMFTRWMIAACHCGIGKGPNGVMLLFIGTDQGTFKTTWLNNLCPPLLSDYVTVTTIEPSLKDPNTVNALAERFIVNIDDQLENIMAKDFNSLKTIITNSFVTNRKTFRRDDTKRIRRANFVGSVNNPQIFRDNQNRRYLAFEIAFINMSAAHEIDMNQVWAEAYSLYRGGARHYFDKSDEAIINALADHHAVVTAEEEWFSRLFVPSDKSDPMAIPYLPTEVLSIIRKASHLNVYERNLATALKKLGISKVKMRLKGYKDPRDVYMLRENFTKDQDKILVKGVLGDGETWIDDQANTKPSNSNQAMQTEIHFKK